MTSDKPEKIFRHKKLWLSLAVLFAVLAGVFLYGVWQVRRLNTAIEFPPTANGKISQFQLAKDCTLVSIYGQRVFFDMGSRHSFVTEEVLEKLRRQGCPMEERRALILTSDCEGHFHFYTKVVRLDIALPNPDMPDSLYYVKNVELLVSDYNDHDNVIGTDVLRYLVIEHIYDTDELRLYCNSRPEGYEKVCDIDVHKAWYDRFGSTHNRGSIRLAVNNYDRRDYFFDTGGRMRDFQLVQPGAQLHSATTGVEVDSVTGVQTQRHCRVFFGSRMHYCDVAYCDTLHTDDYSVNPLRLFNQDILIDFPGEKLYTRKHLRKS